jgi:hypothetical protein
MGWSKDLQKIIERDRLNAEKMLIAAGIQGFNTAVIKTPVGNPDLWKSPPPKGYVGGQLRANWRVSFDRVDYSIKDTTNFAAESRKEANEILSFKLGDTLIVSNPMPYAPRIEYDQWSSQAPEGMITPAVKAVKAAITKRANK